jgi:predicted GIY-YIG superfamily endonuclease
MKEKRQFLYVLELEDSCFYVGQTNDLVRRFRQHLEQLGEGSIWTYLHKPIRMVQYWDLGEYTQEGAMQFENRLTLEYINKYGFTKVRGGEYVFTDQQHHYYSILSRNRLSDGLFAPKITDEGVKTFAKIREQVEDACLVNKRYVYVLELDGNCVYVSRTDRLKKVLYKHFYRKGSLWTDVHRPVGIHEILDDEDLGKGFPIPFQNELVKKYMLRFGWQNVRGGDFKIINEEEHRRLLQKNMPDVLEPKLVVTACSRHQDNIP